MNIFAATFLVLLAALASVLIFRHGNGEQARQAKHKDEVLDSQKSSARSSQSPLPNRDLEIWQERSSSRVKSSRSVRRQEEPAQHTDKQLSYQERSGGVASQPPAKTIDELAVRSGQVERWALGQIERVSQRIELSEEQKDRLFVVFATSSPAYDVRMPLVSESGGNLRTLAPANVDISAQAYESLAGGESSAAGGELDLAERVAAVLDPEQRVAYSAQLIEDNLWWRSSVAAMRRNALIRANTREGAPEGSTVPVAEPAAPESNNGGAPTPTKPSLNNRPHNSPWGS